MSNTEISLSDGCINKKGTREKATTQEKYEKLALLALCVGGSKVMHSNNNNKQLVLEPLTLSKERTKRSRASTAVERFVQDCCETGFFRKVKSS